MFGDSRIAQWDPLPERSFSILRVGYPGESAIRMAPLFASLLEVSRPSAAFVQMGVNDAVAASLVSPSERDAALAASIRAFAAVAQAAEARGVDLTISLVVPPIRPELRRRILYRGAVDSYVAALNAAIPEIAARHGARVVDPLAVLGGADGTVPEAYRLDALHWTQAAYRALSSLLPEQIAAAPASAPIPAEMPG